jgi:hypothetical protein
MSEEAKVFSRADYMDGRCTRHQYWSQFVTPQALRLVKDDIGMKALRGSTDPHLNDIALERWDQLGRFLSDEWIRAVKAKTGDVHNVTTSDRVCILKTAAWMLLGEEDGDGSRIDEADGV